MCYILSSYGCSGSNKCVNNEFDILKDMTAVSSKIFGKAVNSLIMKNKNVNITAGSHRETGERIMVFIKS
jgi:hypothetical protein